MWKKKRQNFSKKQRATLQVKENKADKAKN